ncbi:MAG: putative lipid II flippase FtsW [Acidobacteria bacterium]|nr:putative lipid II flippase FtsW [Acidobacteriota bacterium]
MGGAKAPSIGSRVWEFFRTFWTRLEGSDRPSNGSSYYLILGATLALTCIGLMMVFSASSVESIANNEDPYQLGLRESMFAGIGLVLMFIFSRLSANVYKRLAWPALVLALVLLVLVLVIGVNVNGNTNWIRVNDGFQFQPSEAAKLAIALWMATVLSRKGPLLSQWKHMFIPVVPVAALVVGLVLKQGDLGTSVVMMAIVAAALYFGGAPGRIFVGAGIIGGAAALILAATSHNRVSRIQAWFDALNGTCHDVTGLCDQARSGLYALASGGWWGVGLGQSRQKWNWIPEAHNDFIFAIIGEEFGLIGTFVMVVLYAIIAIAIFRIIVRQNDLFVRVLCGAILAWIIGQAFVNIAMVTGLLPVIGVPLPLVSAGGTALVLVLSAIGVVLSFARNTPQNLALERESDASVQP